MPEPITTPHREGTASAIEAAPGAALAVVLVWISSHTRFAMDLTTASALVLLGSVMSSYVMAFLREHKNQIFRAFGKGTGE